MKTKEEIIREVCEINPNNPVEGYKIPIEYAIRAMETYYKQRNELFAELYTTLQKLGAKSDILSVIGSIEGVNDDEEALASLKLINSAFFSQSSNGETTDEQLYEDFVNSRYPNHHPDSKVKPIDTKSAFMAGIKAMRTLPVGETTDKVMDILRKVLNHLKEQETYTEAQSTEDFISEMEKALLIPLPVEKKEPKTDDEKLTSVIPRAGRSIPLSFEEFSNKYYSVGINRDIIAKDAYQGYLIGINNK